ncbi:MarR family transcriptional regulator [Nonomuraea turkmeniaca]|uniref:MarR family transcriptional regulator n=1 Tax=Nonomuraea turkmeniaca TaxID=103838 RepID=UPI001FE3AEA3|nr:MarR family transcriptional regulator [Nonomuraea turkmeniaca]
MTPRAKSGASDLAVTLVSPASISKAVAELEQQGLIRRERDPRRRRERYVIDADVWIQGWLVSARQNVTMAELARKAAAVVGATTPAGARLKDVSEFFDHVGRYMIQAAEDWQQASCTRRTTSP